MSSFDLNARIVILPALLACLLASPPLAAQAEGDTQRFVYVASVLEIGSDPALATPALALPIASGLAAELERSGFAVTLADPLPLAPRDFASMTREALSKGADVLVVVFYMIRPQPAGERLTIGVRAYDLLGDRFAAGMVLDGKAGIDAFATVDGLAAEIGAKLRTSLPPLTPAELVIRREKVQVVRREIAGELGTPVRFRLECPLEGAEVWASETLLGSIRDGGLEIDAKAGTKLVLSIRKAYYIDRVVEIDVVEATEVVRADRPIKHAEWESGPFAAFVNAIEAAGPSGSLSAGAFVSWYFVPDWASADLQASAQASFAPGEETLSLALAPSANAYLLGFGDSLLRAGVGIGFPLYLGIAPKLSAGMGIELSATLAINFSESALKLRSSVAFAPSLLDGSTIARMSLAIMYAFR